AGLCGGVQPRRGRRDHGLQGGHRLLAHPCREEDPEGAVMSDEMHDDELQALKHAEIPAPGEDARRRALAAAMLAFDAEQQKSAIPTKGRGWVARLRSIVPQG